MLKIEFYVPPSHVEEVKQALFAAGAGRIGCYDCCAWQVLGEGQYRPAAGSRPYQGQPGELERVPEYKVEMVCAEQHLDAALRALLAAHPYEEPAWQAWRLESLAPEAS